MILGDRDLRYYIEKGLIRIEPYSPDIVRENGIDLRIGGEIARLKSSDVPLDTATFDNDPSIHYELEEGEKFVIRPHERVLLTTLEYVGLPDDIMAFVNLRSTFARLGLMIPSTIVDAGFEGNITVEVVGGSFPVILHKGDRFIHLIFAKLLSPVEKPYSGVYQGQRGVRLPRFYKQP
ncbi:MAG: dCTP deaminase [Desulfurococcales archaeon]|nr:dCTP deaminase [Desulfurococcales archaeon]